MPIRRRKVDSASLLSTATSWPNSVISPRVGRIERNRSRSNEVLPAPEGPVRNWNECGSSRNADVAQHLRTEAIAQTYVFKSDHLRRPRRDWRPCFGRRAGTHRSFKP